MSQGFVYVLVNPAMPGLVKVGSTTRSPAGRAAEISQATGVAAPFLLAFQQEFTDCERAERLVHARLAERGLRIDGRREFFHCSATDAIHVIMSLTDLRVPLPDIPTVAAADRVTRLLAEGDAWRDGVGGRLPNPSAAMNCYDMAVSLGAVEGYRHRGVLYAVLKPGPQWSRRAMREFKAGALLGDVYCWLEMAALAAQAGRRPRFERAAARFVEEAGLPGSGQGNGRRAAALRDGVIRYLEMCQRCGWPPSLARQLRPIADEILAELQARARDAAPGSLAARDTRALLRFARRALGMTLSLPVIWVWLRRGRQAPGRWLTPPERLAAA